jgi:hypothetical protein
MGSDTVYRNAEMKERRGGGFCVINPKKGVCNQKVLTASSANDMNPAHLKAWWKHIIVLQVVKHAHINEAKAFSYMSSCG